MAFGVGVQRARLSHTDLASLALHESALELTGRTPAVGCRSLDILHVAAARLLQAELFVPGDRRQAGLGEGEGLAVPLV